MAACAMGGAGSVPAGACGSTTAVDALFGGGARCGGLEQPELSPREFPLDKTMMDEWS